MPTAATTSYTAPSGKFAVVKSVFICNKTSSNITIRLIVGGINVSFDHVVKSNDTLSITDLDIPLMSAETIVVSSSTANAATISVVGFERDYDSGTYPFLKAALSSGLGTTANAIVAVGSNDWIVRSIILTNTSTSNVNVTIDIGSVRFIDAHTIKPKDTLIIPLQVFLVAFATIQGFASVGSVVTSGIVLEKVVQ